MPKETFATHDNKIPPRVFRIYYKETWADIAGMIKRLTMPSLRVSCSALQASFVLHLRGAPCNLLGYGICRSRSIL